MVKTLPVECDQEQIAQLPSHLLKNKSLSLDFCSLLPSTVWNGDDLSDLGSLKLRIAKPTLTWVSAYIRAVCSSQTFTLGCSHDREICILFFINFRAVLLQ